MAEIQRRARDWAEWTPGDPEPDTVAYVCSCVESGTTLLDMASDIGETIGRAVSRAQLSALVNAMTPDATERLALARKPGAHALAEGALVDLRTAGSDRDRGANAARLASAKHWLAERWNRTELGRNDGAQVHVSIGTVHLDAMRQVAEARATRARDTVAMVLPQATVTGAHDATESATAQPTEDAQDVVIQALSASTSGDQ